MFLLRKICFLSLLFLFFSVASSFAEGCVTSACHAIMGKGKFVHEPVAGEECDSCHEETGKKHPGEKGAFTLAASGSALCLMCHDSMTEG